MSKYSTPYIVALDWGTSSFRARLVAASGEVIQTISNNEGILASNGQFDEVLERNLNQLNGYEQGMPVVMSGMIGSRNGWYEAAYTQLPCDAKSLSKGLEVVSLNTSHNIYIIPGLMKSGEVSDVIRGEETEIIGAIEHLNLTSASMIIPGTHSKVVDIEQGKIVDFKTYLTGELFHAICKSTILGSFGNEVNTSSPWFKQGVIKGLNTQHGGELLNLLFTARSRVLVSDMPASESATFISGLLIGSEIGASDYRRGTVWIMGNGKLPQAYQSALNVAGITCNIVPENIVVAGTLSIFNEYKKESL